uniref:Uncharacterized protein n=1 Tax=Panagrellus redivivus TaxID=6233 RepID=A0A7E4W8N6_PANRE
MNHGVRLDRRFIQLSPLPFLRSFQADSSSGPAVLLSPLAFDVRLLTAMPSNGFVSPGHCFCCFSSFLITSRSRNTFVVD